jgi:hypothetical protein
MQEVLLEARAVGKVLSAMRLEPTHRRLQFCAAQVLLSMCEHPETQRRVRKEWALQTIVESLTASSGAVNFHTGKSPGNSKACEALCRVLGMVTAPIGEITCDDDAFLQVQEQLQEMGLAAKVAVFMEQLVREEPSEWHTQVLTTQLRLLCGLIHRFPPGQELLRPYVDMMTACLTATTSSEQHFWAATLLRRFVEVDRKNRDLARLAYAVEPILQHRLTDADAPEPTIVACLEALHVLVRQDVELDPKMQRKFFNCDVAMKCLELMQARPGEPRIAAECCAIIANTTKDFEDAQRVGAFEAIDEITKAMKASPHHRDLTKHGNAALDALSLEQDPNIRYAARVTAPSKIHTSTALSGSDFETVNNGGNACFALRCTRAKGNLKKTLAGEINFMKWREDIVDILDGIPDMTPRGYT